MALKIYASGITDLTSARYFSAMNADMLGFVVNEKNYTSVSEMIQWVSVPYIAVEVNESSPMLENYIDSNDWIDFVVSPSALKVNKPKFELMTLENYNNEVLNEKMIVKINKPLNEIQNNLTNLSHKSNVFLEIEHLHINDIDLLIHYNIYGLVMKAETEQRVGVQSFDLFDQIFDQLEQY